MSISVVTSFSEAQRKVYGQRFMDSFHEHWPSSVRLDVISDEDLWNDPAYTAFYRTYACSHLESESHPEKNALKFSRKVFAMLHPSLPQDVEWRIWIDGDVEHIARVDDQAFAAFCPPQALLGFLGRPGYRYTETGFLAFRIAHPVPRAVLQRYRAIYETGLVFRSRERWGDGFVFDQARSEFLAWADRFHSYTPEDAPDKIHVWPHTVLGKYMRHHKGPRRKATAYGSDS